MAENSDPAQENAGEKTIEEAFAQLEDLAARLEEGGASLEETFVLYKQGLELLKFCSSRLDTVEKKILQMNEDGSFREFSRGIK